MNQINKSLKAGKNKVAVKLDKFLNDEVKHGNLTFAIDPMYRPSHHVNTCGEIYGLPVAVSNFYKPFEQALKRSNRVHFDYKSVEEKDFVVSEEGYKIYFIDLHMVFCAVEDLPFDDAKIVHCNEHVALCEPFYGFGFEEVMMPDGGKVLAKENSFGIVTETNPEPHDTVAYVKHCTPLSGLKSGDLVLREAHTNYEYEIEGETLYVVHTDLILGKMTSQSFSIKGVEHYRPELPKGVVDVTDGDLSKIAVKKDSMKDTHFMES